MRPVKLSLKRASKDNMTVYYTVAIPREIGIKFGLETYFACEVTPEGILLRPMTTGGGDAPVAVGS